MYAVGANRGSGMRLSSIGSATVTAALLLLAVPHVMTAQQQEACTAAEARQFDFWLGEWEVTWDGGRGTNRVDRVLDDCVVRERFDGSGPEGNGLVGTSLSTWSPQLRKWRQTWVDNQGGYLDFEGGMESGKMVLSREARREGVVFLQRMVWHNIRQDSLDWNWERSDDDGKTWKPLWKIRYTRRSR